MKQTITLTALLAVLVLTFSGGTMAKNEKKEQCLETRVKIDKIKNKMRHKYSNKQGIKYRKKLEKLYKDEFKYCF